MISRLAKRARTRLVGDQPKGWEVYHQLIREQLHPGMRVLDVGCGVGHVCPFSWNEFPEVELIGLDPNPEARQNPSLHRFELLTDQSHWPIEDASIDLMVARFVLEHVEKPREFFDNVARVLRPGGRFIALTPNRFHPTMIASAWLPHRSKEWILRVTVGRSESDTFPTFYRLNTLRKLRRCAHDHGLKVEHLEAREYVPISYLDFSVVGFLTAYAYYQTVRALRLESWFGVSIVGVFQKS